VGPMVLLELVVVAGLFLAYRSARMLAGHSAATAYQNAGDVLDWERALALPDEIAVQQLMLSSEPITRLANAYYAAVHFPLTVAFLVWLFVRSRQHYYRIRTSLALLTGLALAIHAAFPLAPARLLDGHGFVDTAARYGPAVYSSPEADSLTNQFAAMPSLHFGWAVMVALGVIRAGRSRYRWLWIAHPVVTLLVIVGTANHYWLDAAVAGALIVLTESALAMWERIGRRVATAQLAAMTSRIAEVVRVFHAVRGRARPPSAQREVGWTVSSMQAPATVGEFGPDPRRKPVGTRQ
jgi:PAP2 superfamily